MGVERSVVARALFGASLRLLPRDFRARSGAAMQATFEERLATFRGGARLGFALREYAGVVGVALSARAAAGRAGGPADGRGKRRAGVLDGVRRDVRVALRGLGRSPGFTVAAVLVLGLGMGASVAIFSAVNAVLVRPLPFPQPERLVAAWENNQERGWVRGQVAPANYLDWRERVAEFAGLAGYYDWLTGMELGGGTEPRRILVSVVTGDFFDVLGVAPLLGRVFREEETWAGGETGVVLSEGLWRSAFHADAGIIGRSIRLDRRAVRVLGVMPAALRFPREQTELWLPMQWSRGDRAAAYFRRAHNLRVVGRLAPGVTVERADARLRQVALVLQGEHADLNRGMEAGAGVLRDYVAQKTRGPVLLLLGAVSLLLLTACANVANLVLVRGAARERELAVRGALGASRLRVTAQLVTESLVLTLLGGGVGMLLGIWGTRLLAAARPPEIELLEGMPLDGRVLLFAVGATALCALLFGSLPALRAARTNLTESLRHAQRTTGGRRTRRAAHALVMAEVALALLLVTGAGLLTRSLWRLARVDSGFDSENVLSFALSLPSASYPDGERVTAFFDAALARMRALPGVLSAGATTSLPLTGPRWGSDFTTEGWGPDRFGTEVHHREIAPGYLETLRVRLVRGRAFDSRDRPDAPLTVLINETLARRYYEGEDPIGKRITFDRVPEAGSVWRTIIGVVAPERQLGMAREPLPEFLAPLAQDWSRTQYLVLRTAGDPRLLLPAVRSEVGRLDASVPLFDVRTLAEVRSASFARERFVMALFGLFAALALLLTLVGVYGVSAQAAKARTREIGIRMALGAQRGSVQRMIVGQGMRLVAGGLALGLAGALAAGRFMRSLLVGVAATDAATYVAVCALLTLSALLASWLPARRAARVDPVVALRDGS